MKNTTFILAAFALCLTACDNVSGYFKNTGSNEAKSDSVAMAPPVSRDLSITEATAYNNLFIDSAAVENYIAEKGLSPALAQGMRNFYNKRNYQYAWFSSDGVTEQGRGIWNLFSADSTFYTDKKDKEAKKLRQHMDTLVSVDSITVVNTDSNFIKTELALTHKFVQNPNSNLTRNESFLLPVRKMNVLQTADTILKKSDSTNMGPQYAGLRRGLQKYYDLAKNGGWQPIPAITTVQKIAKGTQAPFIGALKKRLAATGELSGSDTTNVYNDSLHTAIMAYQQHNGMRPTGMITDTLINTLNIPVEQRLQQILVNISRMHWTPHENNNNVVEVNIPSFMLQVYDSSGNKAFDMPVVVGKEGSNTVMFTGDLNQIVFSPYWNLPTSIVRDEIMPAMNANPNYLKSRNMEVVSKGGGVPEIRQLPGANNSLGKVKFLFPNSYDIYLHDTPAKDLFLQEKRAFSHGCIRLADARKMAHYLLRNDPTWTPEKIDAAMNSGKEQAVALKQTVPVAINYYTAWADENGTVHFREDIYGHDKKAAEKMFLPA